MNKCNINFIKRIGIDLSQIDLKVYNEYDINEITAKYNVQGTSIIDKVSLENIYGTTLINGKEKHNFPEILDDYFDELGDGYHQRSISMLDYNSDNIIGGLSESFISEPIVVLEIDVEKYIILTNGMHRFFALRLLYLHEKTKCKTPDELNDLKEKFSIPVEIVKVDLLKTYCKYLIDLFQPANCMNKCYDSVEEINNQNNQKYYILNEIVGWHEYSQKYVSEVEMQDYLASIKGLNVEYNKDYTKTGKSILTNFNDEQIILTDDELIEYTKNVIINSKKKNVATFMKILNSVKKYESFKYFLETYFIDIFNLEKMEEEKNGNYKTK